MLQQGFSLKITINLSSIIICSPAWWWFKNIDCLQKCKNLSWECLKRLINFCFSFRQSKCTKIIHSPFRCDYGNDEKLKISMPERKKNCICLFQCAIASGPIYKHFLRSFSLSTRRKIIEQIENLEKWISMFEERISFIFFILFHCCSAKKFLTKRKHRRSLSDFCSHEMRKFLPGK